MSSLLHLHCRTILPAMNLQSRNITTLALEVHKDCLTGSGNGVIGGWTTSSVRRTQTVSLDPDSRRPGACSGDFRQLSRVSNPLVNEVVIQINLGVAGGDLAGFPNGRRPGDDVTDIVLRVMMGALCHSIAVDLDLSGTAGDEGDNPGLCSPSDAPVVNAPFTHGAPQNAAWAASTG